MDEVLSKALSHSLKGVRILPSILVPNKLPANKE